MKVYYFDDPNIGPDLLPVIQNNEIMDDEFYLDCTDEFWQ